MKTDTTTKSLLDYIAASATSRSEEDEAYLMKIMQPTSDREEMGGLYTDLLGYNPIKYFDEQDLRRIYASIVRKAPGNIRRILEVNEEKFIRKTMSRLDENREDFLTTLLAKIISEETGWIDPDLQIRDDDDDSFETLEDLDDGDDGLNEDDMGDDDDDDDYESERDGDD